MFLYRLLISLALPFLAIGQSRRIARGVEQPADRAERAARHLPPKTAPSPIWIHAASNGELTAARPLIAALGKNHPLLITCNSVSGRALVQSWNIPATTVQLAPIDTRAALKRFLDHWAPCALVTVENELWPNRLSACAARGIPAAVLSARMSESSARNWARLSGLARQVMGQIALLAPQDAPSGPRFLSLGLPEAALCPPVNLKSAALTAAAAPADLTDHFTRAETVMAASTHSGEDAAVLKAFSAALTTRPKLRLILAPRHPDRAEEIARLAAEAGLSSQRRSHGGAPKAQVYILDTLGELAGTYALASSAFIGGSFVPKGGHTPFEPAAQGCAILHGPHTENAGEIYAALGAGGGAQQVDTAEALAAYWTTQTPQSLSAQTEAAAAICAASAHPDALNHWLERFHALLAAKPA
ncbi:3-deoxy-D-manno-octulosonic acid transferase [Alphaproteobacteria bacterium KMM 3653]|uniref:3-deoxy-D-manno-octulosonic acid transferase n=1 Tax=Harenicola maris TaxID=2841044 RepID=A0AAP2G6E2_9RHOB|nr:3-deoxy-D-manno-octulosonic acid transferase [Harenicola maris]